MLGSGGGPGLGVTFLTVPAAGTLMSEDEGPATDLISIEAPLLAILTAVFTSSVPTDLCSGKID